MKNFEAVRSSWLREALDDIEAPAEPRATCSQCAMCATTATRPPGTFAPETKCCTFWPTLPNFVVGSILSDADELSADGQRRVAALLGSDHATPLGLSPPDEYLELFSKRWREFGRAVELTCPYFVTEGGLCSIWRHRIGECATWFCKVERGRIGQAFWDSAKLFFREVEHALSAWCASELGAQTHGQRLRIAGEPARRAPRGDAWMLNDADRAAYYRHCYALVAELGWSDVEKIGGAAVGANLAKLRIAFGGLLSDAMPLRVDLGKILINGSKGDSVIVTTYRPTDPHAIDRRLLSAVLQCTSMSIEELKELVKRDVGLDLSESLLRRLLDLGILVGAPADRG